MNGVFVKLDENKDKDLLKWLDTIDWEARSYMIKFMLRHALDDSKVYPINNTVVSIEEEKKKEPIVEEVLSSELNRDGSNSVDIDKKIDSMFPK